MEKEEVAVETIRSRPKRQFVDPNKMAEMERQKYLEKKKEAVVLALEYQKMNQTPSLLKYTVLAGNNSQVIKRCMELR